MATNNDNGVDKVNNFLVSISNVIILKDSSFKIYVVTKNAANEILKAKGRRIYFMNNVISIYCISNVYDVLVMVTYSYGNCNESFEVIDTGQVFNDSKVRL